MIETFRNGMADSFSDILFTQRLDFIYIRVFNTAPERKETKARVRREKARAAEQFPALNAGVMAMPVSLGHGHYTLGHL